MKNLTLTLVLAVLTSFASAEVSFHGDAYRFAETNYTGVMGLRGNHWGGELSLEDGGVSIENRQYLAFTNIEIGAIFEVTNSVQPNYIDNRVVDIEGGLYGILQPYVKVGSEMFFVVKLDETNTPAISVGFRLF